MIIFNLASISELENKKDELPPVPPNLLKSFTETQLTPHRRNIQDLLCDSGMIPYAEPYQSMYQRRHLGILGIEWRPGSLKLAVGSTYNTSTGDFQALPIVDLEQWVEPLPEIVEAIDWEIENDMQNDDADSEYNITDEYSSQASQENLSSSSCGIAESSARNSEDDNDGKVGVSISRRKKHAYEVRMCCAYEEFREMFSFNVNEY